jgi:DNA modification methylase
LSQSSPNLTPSRVGSGFLLLQEVDEVKKKTLGTCGADQRVAVCYREISDLILDTRNPRLHSPKQVRQIGQSIEAFGFVVPVLIDAKLRVVAGHGRVMACKLLGRRQVPTISLDHLSEPQIRAFAIADNRLTENSEWNDRLLAEQLRDLAVLDLDFDLEVTGFEMGEIDLRIENLNADAVVEDDPADTTQIDDTGPPVSRPGDLWELGVHRVSCGSALDPTAFRALVGKDKASMAFIDPPYNVKIEGNVGGLGKIHHREFAMATGEMSDDKFASFLTEAFILLVRYSTPGSIHFVCMDWRHLAQVLAAGLDAYTEFKNLCVWAKHTAGMGSLYRSAHELVLVFKNGRAAHRNNIRLGEFGRNRTNVWHYPGAVGLRTSDEGNLLAIHPTVKPVKLIADAIMDASGRGEIVLDSFLGSGTTVIAAERTGRRCYGLEIDPLYTDTIVRRWQTYTGESARSLPTNRTFKQIESEREVADVAR